MGWCEDVYRGKIRGLCLMGNTGCGKTHLGNAACGVLEADGRVGSYFYAPANWVFEWVRQGYGNGKPVSIKLWLDTWPLIMLDDVGAEHVSEKGQGWSHAIYLEIAEALCAKPFVLTTNLGVEQLRERVGGRAWSRFGEAIGANGFVDMFDLPDYRLARASRR